MQTLSGYWNNQANREQIFGMEGREIRRLKIVKVGWNLLEIEWVCAQRYSSWKFVAFAICGQDGRESL